MITEIGDWITAVTGITNTFLEPYEGNRPKAGEYAMFQVISVATPDRSYNRDAANGTDNIDREVISHARVTVSINIYAQDGFDKLLKLKHSGMIWEANQSLGTNLALVQLNNPRNLTALSTESFRERWQADAVFNVELSSTFTIARLKQLVISGEWRAVDSSDIITQDVNVTQEVG